MKVKAVFTFLVAVLLTLSLQGTSEAKDKVGYVNLSLVFDSYNKTKSFDQSLQTEAEGKRVERESLVEAVKKLRDEMELLSPENRAAKQQSIDQKVQELQAFDRDSRLVLRTKRDNMIREILKEIDDVVQAYGQAEGYEYIFNDRILLYKQEASDLSQDIIARLNK
jgi:Skp family chaperone for outer membrane proteins